MDLLSWNLALELAEAVPCMVIRLSLVTLAPDAACEKRTVGP